MSEPEGQSPSFHEPQLPRIEGETHRQYLKRYYENLYDQILSGQLSKVDFTTSQTQNRLDLERRADYDQLTGLLNFQGFADTLTTSLEIIHQGGIPAFLFFLDSDQLKAFNTVKGRVAGNQLIQTTAEVLRQTTSQLSHATTILGRFGGDDFVCLLAGSSIDEAQMLARDIRNAVPQAVQTAFNDLSIVMTISTGFTQVQPKDTTHTLLQRASDALNEAKIERNKIVVR